MSDEKSGFELGSGEGDGDGGGRGLSSKNSANTYSSIVGFIAKFETAASVLSVAIGLALFLLPLISLTWRNFLRDYPVAYLVFDEVTRLTSTVVLIVLIFVAITSVAQWLASSYGFPGGWDVRQEGGLPTGKQVFQQNLYPTTSVREHVIFVLWIAIKCFGLFFWAFLIGCLAFFMRIGEFR